MTIDLDTLPGLPEYKRRAFRRPAIHRLSLRTDRKLPTSFILRRYADRMLFVATMCFMIGSVIIVWDLIDGIRQLT